MLEHVPKRLARSHRKRSGVGKFKGSKGVDLTFLFFSNMLFFGTFSSKKTSLRSKDPEWDAKVDVYLEPARKCLAVSERPSASA